MDSDKLKYFISAAYSLNFSEVARTNFISQPTISHQIDLLERELGVKLFYRNGKKLSLTSEGEYFLPIAVKLLGDMHSAAADVKQYSQGSYGKLNILISETSSNIYKECLRVFSRKYPDIQIDCYFSLSREQITSLIHGTHDFYFMFEDMVKANDEYEYVPTHRDQMCLAVPKGIHVPEDIYDFSSLKDIPFIAMCAENTSVFKSDVSGILERRSFVPRTTYRFNRLGDLLISVELGIGFTVLPYSVALDAGRDVTVVPLPDPECMVNRVVAWRKNSHNRAVELFKEVIFELYIK